MQFATLLYNDRINTFREMKVLDAELDNKPTTKSVMAMAEARIRNLQCFRELQSFNDSGLWINKHPLLVHHSERFQLEELRKRDPAAFLKKYADCSQNIKRYSSYLNNKNRESSRDKDKKNLAKHQERLIIFENILNNEKKDSVL